MFKNVSLKKVIIIGGLAISAGYGMEVERLSVSSRITPRPELNLENVDSRNSPKRVLNFDIDINMDFPEDSSDDYSYVPSGNSSDMSSGEFSMDEDNILPENPPSVHRNLEFDLDAVVSQDDPVFVNISHGFDGNLQDYLNNVSGEGDGLTYEMYVNVDIPTADYIVNINFEADTESENEDERIGSAAAA